MSEYFIQANSFAAPFCSDMSTHFVEADSPEAALNKLAAQYRHPAGLYSAACYTDANAMHKGENPLAQWLSNHARAVQGARIGVLSDGPGNVEIDGKRKRIEAPKEGSVSR